MRLFKKRHPAVGARPGTLVIAEGAVRPRISVLRYTEAGVDLDRELTDVEELPALLESPGRLWIDVQGLGDEAILRRIADIFAFHPLALEDLVNVPQRPKAEPYDQQLLIVTRMARLVDELDLDLEQVSVMVGERYVVTFQERHGDVLEPVRSRLRTGQGKLATLGPDYLAYSIIDTIADAYFPVLEKLGDRLEALEDEIMTDAGPRTLHTLSRVKNLLLLLRRGIWPQRDAVNTLIRDPSRFIGDEVRVYLRDTHDHCVQTAEVVESYRELVGGLMNTYLTVVANRTNDIMKVLTIIATIFIPLTFLAGIYGMNFDHMPELHDRLGYPILLAVMAVIALGLLGFFHRRGWLSGGDD